MRPLNFDEAFKTPLGAGDNPNTGDLPYRIVDDPNTPGVCFLVSCWALSVDELAEIARTGRVYLAVMANPEAPTQPPVSLHGLNPFKAFGDNNLKPWPENWRDIKRDKAINEVIDRVSDTHLHHRAAQIDTAVRVIVERGGDPYTDSAMGDATREEIQAVVEMIAQENQQSNE